MEKASRGAVAVAGAVAGDAVSYRALANALRAFSAWWRGVLAVIYGEFKYISYHILAE